MKVKIYILIDPMTSKIRYIGRTTQSLEKRLIGHLSKSKNKNTHRDFWIQSLLKNGELPKIKLIKVVIGWSNSHDVERFYIRIALKHNFNLTNHDDRGKGSLNKMITSLQKLKISNTLKDKYKRGIIKPTHITPVSTFNLDGKFINKYESCAKCVNAIGISQSSLENILSKRVRRWKNFQVTYGNNPGKYEARTNYKQNNKSIFIYNIIDNLNLKFESYKLAAEYLNVSSPTIRRYIDKVYKEKFYITSARLKLDEFRETLEVGNSELSL